MADILPINNTLEVICSCWNEAEFRLQQAIEKYHPDRGEVFITELFHGHLKDSLDSASQKKLIEDAFIRDLNAGIPLIDLNKNVSRQAANGLIAEVRLHKQTTEAKTGGDLGFVISRPYFYLNDQISPETDLIFTKNYRRGLLTQAKLKNDRGKWDGFTKTQERLLPNHKDYLALLLYSYSDSNRYLLEQFKWQLCGAYPFTDLKDWFKLGKFPNPVNSCRIIKNLGNARIGTADRQKIDNIICPPENQTLTIDIHWPGDGDPPLSKVWIRTKQEAKKQEEIKISVRW